MFDSKARAIVVMGVSGCGKSSVGRELATLIDAEFIEGDSLHPAANVTKMAQGIPLTDDDRWPWLDLIRDRLAETTATGSSVVVSCSALRRRYRDHLRAATADTVLFVFLNGSKELLLTRMSSRRGHFMPTALLESQLATLEDPSGEEGVVTVDISKRVEDIAAQAEKALRASIS